MWLSDWVILVCVPVWALTCTLPTSSFGTSPPDDCKTGGSVTLTTEMHWMRFRVSTQATAYCSWNAACNYMGLIRHASNCLFVQIMRAVCKHDLPTSWCREHDMIYAARLLKTSCIGWKAWMKHINSAQISSLHITRVNHPKLKMFFWTDTYLWWWRLPNTDIFVYGTFQYQQEYFVAQRA